MAKFDVNIVSTGSQGNCVIIDNCIMLDAGVPRKRVEASGYNFDDLRYLAVSHKHGDHKNLALIKYAIEKKQNIIDDDGKTTKLPQIEVHIPEDVYKELDEHYSKFDPSIHWNLFTHKTIITTLTVGDKEYTITKYPQKHHDIINYAFVIECDNHRLLYVTDLDTVEPTDIGPGLTSLGTFDTIIMEGNYDEEWLREYITLAGLALDPDLDMVSMSDEELGKYVRENYKSMPREMASGLFRAVQNMRHLSKQQARAYVKNHLKSGGVYYEVHRSSMFYEKPDGWQM